jgi:hypothetical protein
MTGWTRPDALEVLEPGYAELFDRVATVCAPDDRVRALWCSGSIARGTADVASDLDFIVTVADDSLAEFTREWQAWLAGITPTVIARPLPFAPGSFYSVTPERMRLDVVVEPVAAIATTIFPARLVVFDRDDLAARLPEPPPPAAPDRARIAHLVEEFFRDYGMWNTVVDRGDWLLGLEAVHLLRTLLYQLFVESNAPLPAMGVKRWSDKLTPPQRACLEALPPGDATRVGVAVAHEEAARAFVTAARDICGRFAVPWPDELEASTVGYLRAHGLPVYSDEPS